MAADKVVAAPKLEWKMETATQIMIDPEFEALIPPLTDTERVGLERDLLRDGCRDPLVVWRREDEDVLLDGHNRYQICSQHGLPFSTVQLALPSREDALIWICEHQLHCRNLNETQRAMLAERIATLHQGARTDLSPIGGTSQTAAAKIMKVGGRSIQRARAIRKKGSAKLIEASMRGIVPVSLGESITELPKEEQDQVAEKCIERGDAGPARPAAHARRCAERESVAVQTLGLDPSTRFAVVLTTPWLSMPRSESVVDHRPVLPLDKIKALGSELAGHLAPQAVLFLLVPGSLIVEALDVIKTWGFKYRDQLVWTETIGRSAYVTYYHMPLLVAAKGTPSKLSPAYLPDSVIEYTNYEVIIEKMCPDVPKACAVRANRAARLVFMSQPNF